MGHAEQDTLPTSRYAEGPPGWYGKLSTLGDFAQRRLPAHCVQRCDAWLSSLMRELPQALGPRWLETYLAAPVLRFAWAPGVVDMRWWFGVLMASCDNVGRYFPLVVAQSRTQAPADRAALEQLERWYGVLARAALHTLEDDASLDSFERALSQMPSWPLGAAAALPPPEDAGPWRGVELPPRAQLAGWLPLLATGELLERLAGCTLWWPRAEEAASTLRWGPGLPTATEFAALLQRR
jgi:type VI secretion system protein ImpM